MSYNVVLMRQKIAGQSLIFSSSLIGFIGAIYSSVPKTILFKE